MPRTGAEELADRLAFTAQAMTRLRASALVVREVASHFGVSPKTVSNWVRKVREQRRLEATDADREAARDQLRADFNAIASMALTRTVVVKDKEGNPIVDATTGRPLVRANPDLGRALQALRELGNLDGAYAPQQHEHKIDAKVDAAPDLSDLTPEQLAAGMAFVASLAPDGDMAKLVGDHFRMAGRRPELPDEQAVADAPPK